jgi:tRNA N6-adenosine threonylcarbamoyltransferase
MNILGIETSCDETSIAIIETSGDRFQVRSNIVSSQVAIHERFGGVVPSLAAREHATNIAPVFESALHDAGITDPERDIDLIAVTRGPGLGPALLVGLMFARTLAWRWNKPLVGVDHMDGHIHSNWLGEVASLPVRQAGSTVRVPSFPALNLIVSGGHTELVIMSDHTNYEIIGETQDDAVGEAFDKVARLLDLGYPGGPRISKLALQGNPSAYHLPRPMLSNQDFNFSYSGLKTAVLYLIRDLIHGSPSTSSGLLSEQQKADIAASFQEAAVDVLIEKTRRAAQRHAPATLLLSGGVSANQLLRSRLVNLGSELSVPVFIPDLAYTGDNAAMIAAAGYFAHGANAPESWKTVAMDANLRLGHNS